MLSVTREMPSYRVPGHWSHLNSSREVGTSSSAFHPYCSNPRDTPCNTPDDLDMADAESHAWAAHAMDQVDAVKSMLMDLEACASNTSTPDFNSPSTCAVSVRHHPYPCADIGRGRRKFKSLDLVAAKDH